MKQQLNRTISAIMALLLCVGLFALGATPVSAAEGTCGENLNWKLENGTLTISGSGNMDDYSEGTPAPWSEHADKIQCVIAGDGLTSVGDMAFYHCAYLSVVSLPASVTSVGDLAFAGCTRLTQITLTNVTRIGWGCFYDCTQLSNVQLPDCLTYIGDKAFYNCESLAGITIPENVTEFGTSVFSYCENLVYVKMLAKIDILPYWTFYGCDRLRELYLPASINEVQHSALSECSSLSYVFYSGAEEVEQEIEKQLSEEITKDPGEIKDTKVEYEQTADATVTKTTESSEVTISATVTDTPGWDDVVESIKEATKTDKDPTVVVEVLDNAVPDGTLIQLAEKEVTITIHTSENVDWQVVLPDQTGESLSGQQDLTVSIVRNTSDKYSKIIGNALSYIVTLGDTSLNSTVLLPLGREAARQTATLYVIDGKDVRKMSSVIVDDDGKAAFCMAGTEAGEYLVAINVQDIPQEEVIIPQKLAPEYGIEYTYGATLTDAYGNQYILTGRVNKLGFGIGTLTWIIVGVLGGSIVVVGVVMFMWNKQQKRSYAQQYRRKK